MKNQNRHPKKFSSYLYALLPILTFVFFILFYYANNVEILLLSDLFSILIPGILIAIILVIVFFILTKKNLPRAILASIIFIIFFFLYGIVFDFIRKIDIIQIENYSLLPIYIVGSLYLSLSVVKISNKLVKNFLFSFTILVIGLIAINLVKIIPSEFNKNQLSKESAVSVENTYATDQNNNAQMYPDIYFIILDEAAGFDIIKDFFGFKKVEEFVTFLQKNDFYVADKSRAAYAETLNVIASRLNYQQFAESEKQSYLFEAIANNKVMKDLKAKGYTTIVFDETIGPLSYSTKPPIQSDYTFAPEEYKLSNQREKNLFSNQFFDLVVKQTMLRPIVTSFNNQYPSYTDHKNMIFFTMQKIGEMNTLPSPKFVYVHLLLPHTPFMFDENGDENFQKYYENWNYYLDNYKFALKVAESMITTILKSADQENDPIIILQSDHGARNSQSEHPDFVPLENYPIEYKTHIINAIRIPNCENAPLTQDFNPVNTFPVVFECIFGAANPAE